MSTFLETRGLIRKFTASLTIPEAITLRLLITCSGARSGAERTLNSFKYLCWRGAPRRNAPTKTQRLADFLGISRAGPFHQRYFILYLLHYRSMLFDLNTPRAFILYSLNETYSISYLLQP